MAAETVVITGCGWVTPAVSGTIPAGLDALRRHGPAVAGEDGFWAVPDSFRDQIDAPTTELERDRGSWLTALATQIACRDAALDLAAVDANRLGLVHGCALAGQQGMIGFADEVRGQSPRFVSPIHFPQTVGNYVSGVLARAYDIRGPNLTIATGPTSGLDAIIEAACWLGAGAADVIVAGGSDTLTPALAAGFALPGVVLSEGACLFVLERASDAAARGVRVLADVQVIGTAATDQLGADADRTEGEVLSCAGAPAAGAGFIEHWVGQCFGALGAAAVAAAIGTAAGEEIPVTPTAARTPIVIRQAGEPHRRGVGRTAAVTILTGPPGNPSPRLRLHCPPNAA